LRQAEMSHLVQIVDFKVYATIAEAAQIKSAFPAAETEEHLSPLQRLLSSLQKNTRHSKQLLARHFNLISQEVKPIDLSTLADHNLELAKIIATKLTRSLSKRFETAGQFIDLAQAHLELALLIFENQPKRILGLFSEEQLQQLITTNHKLAQQLKNKRPGTFNKHPAVSNLQHCGYFQQPKQADRVALQPLANQQSSTQTKAVSVRA